MIARWDVLLVAAALAGGSMLIESSHRLDTGAPDDEVAGASTCTSVVSVRMWKPGEDDATDTDAVQLPPGCTPE